MRRDIQHNGSGSERSDAAQGPPPLVGKKIPGSLDEILTLEECAAWLVLKPRDLKDKVRAGRIPAIRLNKRVLRFHPRTVLLKLGVPNDAVGMSMNHGLVQNPPIAGNICVTPARPPFGRAPWRSFSSEN